MDKIPPLGKLIITCGFDPNNITTYDFEKVFPKGPGLKFVKLEDNDPKISTKHELGVALLVDTEAVITNANGAEILKSLSKKDRGLHAVFLIRDLKRMYPEKIDFYNKQEKGIQKYFSLSDKEITDHCIGAAMQDLKEFAKENMYFKFEGPNGEPISPEMNIILQYLVAGDKERPAKQKALENLAKNIALAAKEKSDYTPEGRKIFEFDSVVKHYDDIEQITAKITTKILLGTALP